MIYVLLPDNNPSIDVDVVRATEDALSGDIIMTGTIPIYNKVLRLLATNKPDVMVYVRMWGVHYFPAVGAEAMRGPDTDPILYPPDGGLNGDG